MVQKTVRCRICGKSFGAITWGHLNGIHQLTFGEYRKLYPKAPLCSEETMAKRARGISKALKGRKPAEHIMKLAHEKAREANTGKPRPSEVRKKISEGRLRRKARLGYLNSPKTRRLISEAKRGIKHTEKSKVEIGVGVRQFYDDHPEKRLEVSRTTKRLIAENPKRVEAGRRSIIERWKNERDEMVNKIRKGKKEHTSLHIREILKAMKNFENDGFRCIPTDRFIAKVNPDFVAFKDSRIYAVEVEVGKNAKPGPQKYEGIDYFDDVFWIVIRGVNERKSKKSPKF